MFITKRIINNFKINKFLYLKINRNYSDKVSKISAKTKARLDKEKQLKSLKEKEKKLDVKKDNIQKEYDEKHKKKNSIWSLYLKPSIIVLGVFGTIGLVIYRSSIQNRLKDMLENEIEEKVTLCASECRELEDNNMTYLFNIISLEQFARLKNILKSYSDGISAEESMNALKQVINPLRHSVY